jgi:hypothetical protein
MYFLFLLTSGAVSGEFFFGPPPKPRKALLWCPVLLWIVEQAIDRRRHNQPSTVERIERLVLGWQV